MFTTRLQHPGPLGLPPDRGPSSPGCGCAALAALGRLLACPGPAPACRLPPWACAVQDRGPSAPIALRDRPPRARMAPSRPAGIRAAGVLSMLRAARCLTRSGMDGDGRGGGGGDGRRRALRPHFFIALPLLPLSPPSAAMRCCCCRKGRRGRRKPRRRGRHGQAPARQETRPIPLSVAIRSGGCRHRAPPHPNSTLLQKQQPGGSLPAFASVLRPPLMLGET